MVLSAVFITDLQGKSIISRNYRGDVPSLSKSIERFGKYLNDTPEEQQKPVFYTNAEGDLFFEENVEANPSSTSTGESFVYVSVCLSLLASGDILSCYISP